MYITFGLICIWISVFCFNLITSISLSYVIVVPLCLYYSMFSLRIVYMPLNIRKSLEFLSFCLCILGIVTVLPFSCHLYRCVLNSFWICYDIYIGSENMKDWQEFFKQEQEKAYYQELMKFLEHEYKHKKVYPKKEELFTCFEVCAYEDVKVVILGQDPYHGAGQAHGLSFSVKKGVKIPPSLKNIYKELQDDIGIKVPIHGCLLDWAKQGVFLLNSVLSVEEGKAGSHRNIGWEQFSDAVIEALNQHEQGIVFILWGNWAKKKAVCITNEKHRILYAPHPSPLSAYQGFFKSRPFSQTNTLLQELNRTPIDWQIKE